MSTLCSSQFWAPVTINDRRLLSTSGQPFVIPVLNKESAIYRLHSEKYEYDMYVNKLEIEGEGDLKIRSGGPASAFRNPLSCMNYLLESERFFGLMFHIMIPICYPSDQSDCIGVVEITLKHWFYLVGYLVSHVQKEVQKVGLDICKVQQHIPYETINGLKHASEIVCKSHNLGLAQVWVSFEDKTHVRLSSCLEDTRKILGLNLTGYLYNVFPKDFYLLEWYYTLCQVFPLESTSEEHVLVAFQDFKPRYIYAIHDDEFLFQWEELDRSCCAFTICLKSLETGNFTFLFQFIWPSPPEDSRCDVLLEAILLTIKRCLPSFKFASGAKIGDGLDVIDVGGPKEDQNTSFKLFQGKQTTVVDNISPSKETYQTTSKVLPPDHIENQLLDDIFVTNPTQKPKANHKTAKKNLTREVIEKQFGKTMKEAAHHLKDLGILEWRGPNSLKRKANDSWSIQINTNEANVTTQEPSTVNINKNIMFIKADYADDMIRFDLHVSQATFATVEKTIGVKFKLNVGTFKLNYIDEYGDWILLSSDEEMKYYVKYGTHIISVSLKSSAGGGEWRSAIHQVMTMIVKKEDYVLKLLPELFLATSKTWDRCGTSKYRRKPPGTTYVG
ncbi:hypothetical protein E3N88_15134 [Mikania micrantha]|uniref:PB1 domain-containing protein n=1 Tax=Mikania micrantha TaxID=192012 RepID=A0A5N6NUS3_9ASTR|nr:hypothetical protein E3N88_15134 [Mikania micrantha]